MNKKHIVAAALALSLSLSSSNTQAAEASVDLGAYIQQVIAEIHVGDTDWNKMIGRIDRLVAHIDEQVLEGLGDPEELNVSRSRLLRAKANIQEQYVTAELVGEVEIDPISSAPCEICGQIHSAPVSDPDKLSLVSVSDGSVSGGGSTAGSGFAIGGSSGCGPSGCGPSGGGISGGGGGGGISGGGGGFGGIGVLGGIAAWIAFGVDDNNNGPGIVASPSTP